MWHLNDRSHGVHQVTGVQLQSMRCCSPLPPSTICARPAQVANVLSSCKCDTSNVAHPSRCDDIIRRCGPARLRANGFAPRVLAARAAAVALVEDAPATTPDQLLAMSLQQTCPPLELEPGESLRDSGPSTQAFRDGWLMQSNSAGVSKPTHILTTNCLLGA